MRFPNGTRVQTILDGFRSFNCHLREGWVGVVACEGEWKHSFALSTPLQAPLAGPALAAIAYDFASLFVRRADGSLASGDGPLGSGDYFVRMGHALLERVNEAWTEEDDAMANAGSILARGRLPAAARQQGVSSTKGRRRLASEAESHTLSESLADGRAEDGEGRTVSGALPLGASLLPLDSCFAFGPFRVAAMLAPGLLSELVRRYPLPGTALLLTVGVGTALWVALFILLSRATLRCVVALRMQGQSLGVEASARASALSMQ